MLRESFRSAAFKDERWNQVSLTQAALDWIQGGSFCCSCIPYASG